MSLRLIYKQIKLMNQVYGIGKNFYNVNGFKFNNMLACSGVFARIKREYSSEDHPHHYGYGRMGSG